MIPVVISGGSGTRLWPVSRASYPKQFAELLDESLQGKCLKRLQPLGSPFVLTVGSLKVLTEKLFSDLSIPKTNALYEPQPKNTAPAIAFLCRYMQLQNKTDEVVGIFPADHLVSDEKNFLNVVHAAEVFAHKGVVVTLGIQPGFAATGYGYIEVDKKKSSFESEGISAYNTQSFREKPDVKTAESYLQKGNYFWNSGMFIFSVKTMIEALEKHVPAVWKPFLTLKSDLSNLAEIYSIIPSDSIDYAVMEKISNQVCIPCDIGWSDVGSWDEVAKVTGEGHTHNINKASVYEVGSKNNFVVSARKKIISLVGVEDLMVIDTEDALLLVKKGESQYVKNIVDQIKKEGGVEATEHIFDYRPWGRYTTLRDEDAFKVKKIVVHPGHRLSYQSHTKRQEHWVMIQGIAEVTLNDEVHSLKKGDSIYIPKDAKHRIKNPGAEDLVFVEVQTGTYFGEDDIHRYQDDYARKD
jgi:mannose-1-phosphate guanylyltransferase/mannose-6-phosphate isomerase